MWRHLEPVQMRRKLTSGIISKRMVPFRRYEMYSNLLVSITRHVVKKERQI